MKLSTWLISVPLGILGITVAVANRQTVGVSLDPFSTTAPALSFEAPMFAVIFGAVFLGMVIGGTSMWINQGHYRRRAWAEYRHARELERKVKSQATPGTPAEAAD